MLTRNVEKNLTWIDCVSPTPAEARSLMQEFNLDTTFAQEMLLPTSKPKVERRGDIIYAVLHFPIMHGPHQEYEHEIDFLIGKNFLITVRYENFDPLHVFAKAFDTKSVFEQHSVATHGGHIFVLIMHGLYRALTGECDAIRRRLRDIEEHVFNGDERRMVAELSQAGRIIHDFRQSLLPQEEMLAQLEPVTARQFGPEFTYYIRHLIGSYDRIERTLRNLHDSLTELRETNNSLLSTKQNDILKTFTALAFFCFPLSLISSLFGMDTKYMPIIGQPYDFWIIVGIMATIALGFFAYFKHKDWL